MTPQLARRILGLAVVLGVLANSLLKVNSWRAGFALWVIAVLGVAWWVARDATTDAEPSARRERLTLYGAAAVLVSLLVLRDAPTLYALDFFAFIVVMFLVAWRASGRSLTQLEPRDALIGAASAATAVVAGTPTLATRDAEFGAIDAEKRKSYKGFGIGAIVALPVLFLVTGLLASADPLFAGFVEQTGVMLEGKIAGHILFTAAAAWVTAGALRGSLVPVGITGASFRRELSLSFSSVAPLLGGLALLLTAWIGLQVRMLFGGSEYIAATAGVTVAEYARQGFFELIVISGIVLAALLVSDDFLERTPGKTRNSFRTLGQLLVVLVGAVLVSAVLRLGLYLSHFGLTDDRVLALAVLVWVALVLVWFAMTVLRGARTRFAPGVLVLSAIWLGALNIANPERWIVEVNIQRAERGLPFDVAYHAKLSGDALPSMLAKAERLGAERAAELRAAVKTEWAARAVERADWRRWSLPYVLGVKNAAQ